MIRARWFVLWLSLSPEEQVRHPIAPLFEVSGEPAKEESENPGSHALQNRGHSGFGQLHVVPVHERVVHVLVQVILVFEVVAHGQTVHLSYRFQFGLNNKLATPIELWVFEVERSKLERRLEDIRDSVVEDLVPEENTKVHLHEGVLDVEPIPALLLTVIFECEILNVEEFGPSTVSVDCPHMLPCVGSLRIYHDLFVEGTVHLNLVRQFGQVGKRILFFLFDQSFNIFQLP